jgi:hypothetical protein
MRALPRDQCTPDPTAPLSRPTKQVYIYPMETLFMILIPIAMLATLAVLGFGVVQMIRGGDPRKSNKLMQSRIILQGIALVLFAIFMMFIRH